MDGRFVWMAGLLLALALSGCSEAKPPRLEDKADLRLYDLGMATSPASDVSIPPRYAAHLLDDDAQFTAAWARHHNTSAPNVPFKFRTSAFFEIMGTPQAGWTIRVDNASFEGGLYVLHISTTEPGVNCVAAAVASQVADFVTFDRQLAHADDLKLRAIRTHATQRC